MSWSVEWGGRATDFIPELLKANGTPGRLARACGGAAYEAVQRLGEQDPQAWVKVRAQGWDDKANPGLGQFELTVMVLGDEPSEIQEALQKQQPVDLLGKTSLGADGR